MKKLSNLLKNGKGRALEMVNMCEGYSLVTYLDKVGMTTVHSRSAESKLSLINHYLLPIDEDHTIYYS